MRQHKIALIILWVFGVLLTNCAATEKPAGVIRSIEGQIDNIFYWEIGDEKEFYTVTHVGFTNGQGVSLVGFHPGLSKGKKVRLTLSFKNVIRGTPYYHVMSIYSQTTGKLDELPLDDTSNLP